MNEFKTENLVKLTDFQREYIINKFFKKYSSKISEEVANKLLDKGRCIVPGDGYICGGGIGNFIDSSELNDAVGCSLLTLDLKNFLKSELFEYVRSSTVKELLAEIETLSKKHSELMAL